MRKILFFIVLLGLCVSLIAQPVKKNYSIKIGNFHPLTPYGICIVVDDKAGMVIDPDYPEKYGQTRYGINDPAAAEPALTAPDYSFSEINFEHDGAKIRFSWGKFGNNSVIASLESDKSVELSFKIYPGWPRFHLYYYDLANGLAAWGLSPDGEYIPFKIIGNPIPVISDITRIKETAAINFRIEPGEASVFTAGVDELPALEEIPNLLNQAKEKYLANQVKSEGDWGNFAAAVTQNLNNAKFYSSDNNRLAHIVGRGWWITRKQNTDLFPYFVWDGFFASAMSSIEDIEGARNTVRAIISYTTPAGFVPSYSHWSAEIGYTTLDRSMPPVGSLCVWKIHQRFPDKSFLEEVYPKLVSWHYWWHTARDGNKDGLLEWGSELKDFGFAMLETGWDDNVHYLGCKMEGTTMNADAVDLNALWSMDTEYLAKIAKELGKTEDVAKFENEKKEINERINKTLWNEQLGIYCSRLWNAPDFVENKKLETKKVFKDGFQTTFYQGSNFEKQVSTNKDTSINFNWKGKSPLSGITDTSWSARFTGKLSVSNSATYRFVAYADDALRIYLDDKLVMDEWGEYDETKKYCDVPLLKGKEYNVKIEYVQRYYGSSLKLDIYTIRKSVPEDAFLTRITAMNFYSLMSGAPDKEKAAKTLNWLYRSDKFWGNWIVPTVSYDDPEYPKQGYWRGYVWPPCNYLLYEGVKRYASSQQKAEFVRKSVNLFMRNWTDKKLCCENYNSINGNCGEDPHYTWGALLAYLGVEALVDINEKFEPVVPQVPLFNENIILHNIPFGGKLYTIENKDGKTSIKLQQ